MTTPDATPQRSLRSFTGAGYDKGRPVAVQALWFAMMNLMFMKWWFPGRWRPTVLRTFGAQIGERVLIRHRVRILWPWKLSISDDCWIGEDAWLLNLEPITIEHDVSSGGVFSAGKQPPRPAGIRQRPDPDQRAPWIAPAPPSSAGLGGGEIVPAGGRSAARTCLRTGAADAVRAATAGAGLTVQASGSVGANRSALRATRWMPLAAAR
jgi:putative colanic acid biosynthesis acetyltransferase WcaF